MSPALLGFLRGAAFAIAVALLSYLGDATHLTFLNPVTASVIASIALGLEHSVERKTGNALFGAVTVRDEA
jgi:hypothetical protein